MPRCFAATWESGRDGAEAFVLVLERLGGPEWSSADVEAGCTDAQALAAMEALGRFHAVFCENHRLLELPWLPLMPVHLEYGPMVQHYFATCFAGMRDNLHNLLSRSALAACENMCGSYAATLERLAQPPLTLLHGDFRLENLRFSAASSTAVAAFDWQFVSRGRGAYDVAYFLGLSRPPAARRACEKDLVQAYLQAFGSHVNASEFEDDLRAGFLLVLASFIIGAATAKSTLQEMHWRSVRWLGEAVDDWNAASQLQSPL